MTMAAPLWLIALLPWFAVVLWLFTGRHEKATVPFLELWRGPVRGPRPRAALRRPPLAILCAVLAMLLAIVAAGRPGLRIPARPTNPASTRAATQAISQNIAIADAAARLVPRPQLMVRLRNDSDLKATALKISSEGWELSRPIDLPARGMTQNYFIDLEKAGSTISVEVQANDDRLDDNSATLVQQRASPVVGVAEDVPDPVRRVVEAYSRLHPPGPQSARVAITSARPRDDQPAVIIAAGGVASPDGPLRVEDHPVTAYADWPAALSGALVAPPPPQEENWHPIVLAGPRVVVAVRESPVRQVWMGLDSKSWPRTSGFVVFWGNVLDWVGQGGEMYVAQPIAHPVVSTQPSTLPAAPASAPAPVDVSSFMAIASLVLLLLSAALWARR